MPNHLLHNRRHFLKMVTAAGAFFMYPVKVLASRLTAGWRNDLRINPLIDNVKVVYCCDSAMVEHKIANDFAHQNEGVNNTLIAANMDEIAKRLTNQSSPAAAWQVIFRKPSAKQWNQVSAAIKVSCANTLNMPRVAIVNKVCTELINQGVAAGNITIYDTRYNASGAGKYGDSLGNPIPGLPSGIAVSTATLAGPNVPVGNGSMPCSPVIAREDGGAIVYLADILVNIAANNGSNATGSELDLCMNNHAGTLKLSAPTPDELIDMNQSEAVIGEETADVPCRQQLCIIDSLWATASDTGPSTFVDCRIVMGMLPPIVDILTAEFVRKPQRLMNTPYDTTVTAAWLSRFGFPTIDPQWWIEYKPSTGTRRQHRVSVAGATVITVALGPPGNAHAVRLFMPANNAPVTIDVLTLNGRRVRRLSLAATRNQSITVAWQNLGKRLGAGSYTLRCRMAGEEQHALVKVDRAW
ncbi:MAG: hypothetical protein JXA71_09610 [Chitinispirillaceae bacterium]|nr:hypothetical protein [Chitinispirillaceae bacterium]